MSWRVKNSQNIKFKSIKLWAHTCLIWFSFKKQCATASSKVQNSPTPRSPPHIITASTTTKLTRTCWSTNKVPNSKCFFSEAWMELSPFVNFRKKQYLWTIHRHHPDPSAYLTSDPKSLFLWVLMHFIRSARHSILLFIAITGGWNERFLRDSRWRWRYPLGRYLGIWSVSPFCAAKRSS